MRLLLVVIAILLLLPPGLYAQQDPDDPGIQDSIIIGPAPADSGALFINIPVYAVTDDSVYFYNMPLWWYAPFGGVWPENGASYFPPIPCWVHYDTVVTNPNLIRLIAWNIDEHCEPLFTHGMRQHILTLRFIIEPGTRRQLVTVDSCYDPRNGPIMFGLMDGITEITPAVRPGFFVIIPPVDGVDEPDLGPPKEISLSQNYPNPFNALTEIRFSLGLSGQVRLEIYDMLGRFVRELIDNPMGPGSYSVTWDGKNSMGEEAPSGIYFYRMKFLEFSETRKLLLLR